MSITALHLLQSDWFLFDKTTSLWCGLEKHKAPKQVVFLCFFTNTSLQSRQMRHSVVGGFRFFFFFCALVLLIFSHHDNKDALIEDNENACVRMTSYEEGLWELVDCHCLFLLITLHLFSQYLLCAFPLFSSPFVTFITFSYFNPSLFFFFRSVFLRWIETRNHCVWFYYCSK